MRTNESVFVIFMVMALFIGVSILKELRELKTQNNAPVHQLTPYQLNQDRQLAIQQLRLYMEEYYQAIKYVGISPSDSEITAHIKTFFAKMIAPFQSGGHALVNMQELAGTAEKPTLLAIALLNI